MQSFKQHSTRAQCPPGTEQSDGDTEVHPWSGAGPTEPCRAGVSRAAQAAAEAGTRLESGVRAVAEILLGLCPNW